MRLWTCQIASNPWSQNVCCPLAPPPILCRIEGLPPCNTVVPGGSLTYFALFFNNLLPSSHIFYMLITTSITNYVYALPFRSASRAHNNSKIRQSSTLAGLLSCDFFSFFWPGGLIAPTFALKLLMHISYSIYLWYILYWLSATSHFLSACCHFRPYLSAAVF